MRVSADWAILYVQKKMVNLFFFPLQAPMSASTTTAAALIFAMTWRSAMSACVLLDIAWLTKNAVKVIASLTQKLSNVQVLFLCSPSVFSHINKWYQCNMFTLMYWPCSQIKRDLVILVDTMTQHFSCFIRLSCKFHLIIVPPLRIRYQWVCQPGHLQPDLHQPDRQLQMPVWGGLPSWPSDQSLQSHR